LVRSLFFCRLRCRPLVFIILSRHCPRKGVNQADHSRIKGLIVAITLGPAHGAASLRRPEAIIEPFGNASAAATPSRSGAFCPVASMDGSRARMVFAELVSRVGK
jgi:hypothetical protein